MPTAPLKIAMLGLRGVDGKLSGGVESHVAELSARMARRGHEVTVFCRAGYVPPQPGEYRGARRVVVPAVHTKHLEAITHTFCAMPSVVCGFDIVHFHGMGPSLMSWAPRLFGRRVVATAHGLDFLRAKWGMAARTALRAGAWCLGRFPHETIAVSRKLRDYYIEHMGRFTHYIPNGVNQPAMRDLDALAERFDLVRGEYILSLGRLTPEKGAHYLVEAFRGMDTSFKLVVAGDELFDNRYSARLRELAGGDRRIVFTGGLYGADKDEAFANAAAFVLPSDLEGMPIAMLEAMSYGCPVLSSDIAECDEIWDEAERRGAGTICSSFAAANVNDLRRALEALLRDPGRIAMGARAREYVLSRYDWDEIADATLDVYAAALGGKRREG